MAGAEGLASPSARWSPAAVPPSARTFRASAVSFKVNAILQIWLGRKDSNLRMTGSKPAALPLGYAPVDLDLLLVGKQRVHRRLINALGNQAQQEFGCFGQYFVTLLCV